MTPIYIIHVILLIILCSIPFWPLKYLMIGLLIPLALTALWVVCDGCPLSVMHPELNGETFDHNFLNKFITISPRTSNHIKQFVMVGIPVVAALRIIKSKG